LTADDKEAYKFLEHPKMLEHIFVSKSSQQRLGQLLSGNHRQYAVLYSIKTNVRARRKAISSRDLVQGTTLETSVYHLDVCCSNLGHQCMQQNFFVHVPLVLMEY
jgi:hypothetical protein